jgi:hypothetical protein
MSNQVSVLGLLAVVAAAAVASAAPAPAAPAAPACRIAWRASGARAHDLDDDCLPAVSADGRRVAVARIESGSFTILVLSVGGKGRVLRSFHAADVGDLPAVNAAVRAVNAVLARDGYRRLPQLALPGTGASRPRRGRLELGLDGGRLAIACGPQAVGRSRRLGSVRDEPLGLHRELLTALFLADAASFVLMKVEPVDRDGFYLPGGVEWLVVPFTACP